MKVDGMQIPFLTWVFQGIPESIALATFIMSNEPRKLQWNIVLTIGLIQAVISYVVRLLPFTPGVHTLILVTTLSILSIMIGKIEMKRAVMLNVIIVAFLIIFEAVFFNLLIYLQFVTYEALKSDQITRIIFGTPQTLVIFFISYLVRKRHAQ